MKIYSDEKQLGLEQRILASRSFTSASKVQALKDTFRLTDAQQAYQKSEAGIANASYNDLYWVETILVSSGQNLNTDTFGVEEIWRARHTPINKPMNIGHVPDCVCGTMTRSWALHPGMRKVVDESTPEKKLPEALHIASAGVIWKDLKSVYSEAIKDTILAIEEGNMYVSMECRFDDFDYGLFHPESGELKVIARTEETAWLSAMLTWFGGGGKYKIADEDGREREYILGRYLKGITFTGKGFVTNPANPDSIILNKSFEPLAAASVVRQPSSSSFTAATNQVVDDVFTVRPLTIGDNTMPQELTLNEISDLKAKAMNVERVEKENATLAGKLEKMTELRDTKKTEADAFQLTIKEHENLLATYREESKKKDEEMKKKDEEKASLEKELVEARKNCEEEKAKREKAEQRAAELELAATLATRVAQLTIAGITEKDAEAFAKKWATVSDEQYKDVAQAQIDAHTTKATLAAMAGKGNEDAAKALETMKVDPKDVPGVAAAGAGEAGAGSKEPATHKAFAGLSKPLPLMGQTIPANPPK